MLKRFVNDEFDVTRLSDEFGEEGWRLSKRMQEINPVSLKEILNEVRRMGEFKGLCMHGGCKINGVGRG